MRTVKFFLAYAMIFCLFSQIAKSQPPTDSNIWKFKTSGAVYSTPLIQNDTMFIGSLDSCFYAIDVLTGQQLWKYKTKSKINTTASIYENTICFGSGNYLYGLDLNGNFRWEFQMYTGTAVIQNDDWDYFNSSPRLLDSIAYIGTENNIVYGVNVKNGAQVFKCQGTDGNYTVETTPVIYDGKIFFGNWNGFFYAYDLNTGNKVWSYDTNIDNHGRPGNIMLIAHAVMYNGNICFTGRGGYFYCKNPSNGQKIWNYRDPSGLWILGLTVQDTTFYTGSSYQRYARSINALHGTQNWLTGIDYISYGSPWADTTYLFTGTGDDASSNKGTLFAINKITGVIKTKLSVDGRIQSSPILYKDVLYFGCGNGYIYAVDKQKFVNANLPKIELKTTTAIDLGKVTSSAVPDTFIYVSNSGAASDSVTFSSSRSEATLTPAWAIIEPGDSVKVEVSLNCAGLTAKKYSGFIYAYSNYSPFHENLRRTISFEIIWENGLDKLQTNEIELIQFPNPLSEFGTVQYNLDRSMNICLSVCDASGKLIILLDKGYKSKGIHQVKVDGNKLSEGIYFFRLTTDEYSTTKKMIVTK
jgi:eukaryotic-like serine/threonine-protein kinase